MKLKLVCPIHTVLVVGLLYGLRSLLTSNNRAKDCFSTDFSFVYLCDEKIAWWQVM